ncbi:hypothetical protein GCM10023115_21130 [Pontixanthobacter gangjinensis]|uniref:Uncharacterized protein n=1 Tax=Pontixanthobacter gangjinensis TaxID=1028742 RepID=A0A6I4SN80_9SPHN|nr:hypothetical protein [Pontixanthobacter gangjinensis]MXO57361.1 hypothetical protein [Pontixanthobacter gangjinensis]
MKFSAKTLTAMKALTTACIALGLTLPQPVFAQDVDFGDDSSEWAIDGECDDPRFTGPGMTTTPLLDSDIRADATDCKTAFDQGRIELKSGSSTRDSSRIAWGDDNGEWANDGECDDMRFEGPGMTTTPLLVEDVKHDASDCRSAYEAGKLELRSS